MQENAVQNTISQSSLSLIMKLVKKSYKQEEQQEVLNDIVAIVEEVKRDSTISSEHLREKVLEKLKGELATKDFVRADISDTRESLKAEISDTRESLKAEILELSGEIREVKQKMQFYAIGLAVLMVFLQPRVFEFITAFLK